MKDTTTRKTRHRVRVKAQKPRRDPAALGEHIEPDEPVLTAEELDVLFVILEQMPEGENSVVLSSPTDRQELALRMLEKRGLIRYWPPIFPGATVYVERVPHTDKQLASQARYGRKYEARLRRAERA